MTGKRTAVFYQTPEGEEPAKEWLISLKDMSGKAKIYVRIARAENGNFGDHKKLNAFLYELRILTGPGYRVYFSLQEKFILIFRIGSKATQKKDIQKAKEYFVS